MKYNSDILTKKRYDTMLLYHIPLIEYIIDTNKISRNTLLCPRDLHYDINKNLQNDNNYLALFCKTCHRFIGLEYDDSCPCQYFGQEEAIKITVINSLHWRIKNFPTLQFNKKIDIDYRYISTTTNNYTSELDVINGFKNKDLFLLEPEYKLCSIENFKPKLFVNIFFNDKILHTQVKK